MTAFSIPRPSKFYQNLDFWFENKPSGNPGFQQLMQKSHGKNQFRENGPAPKSVVFIFVKQTERPVSESWVNNFFKY
jgi:hypothetical protein